MPRGERPLPSDGGPVTALAAELRALRRAAGGPSYREMARRAHYSSSALADAAGGRRLPSLDITLAYVRACEGDEEQWRRRWQDAAAESAREVPEPMAESPDAPAPYVGLAAFGVEDAERFAGREAVVEKLLTLLERQRFLALFGASGEGKSSVLHAGLLPGLASGRHVVLAPGPDPVEELAVQLARLTGRPASAVLAELAEDPRALHLLGRELAEGDGDLVVVVDQFEEVFTLCPNQATRSAFIELLLTAAHAPTSRVRVVLGVRSDFYAHCAAHPDLAEALEGAQVLLGAMSVEEFRRAVVRPAAAEGCTVESALVTQLVADAAGRTGLLPLVSHALLETWRRRRGNTLTLAGYHAAGGIRSALLRTAEAVYADLPSARQVTARQILLRLTAPGEGTDDTKRRVPRDQLLALGEDVEPVLDVLAKARLVTVTDDSVDITHEALFQAWPRLREWLHEDRDGLRVQRELTEAATTWQHLERDPGVLFRTTRLATTAAWARRTRPALTAVEREFLDRSLAAEAHERRSVRRRRRALAAAVAAVLVAATAVAIPVVRQRRLADQVQSSRDIAGRVTDNPVDAARNALAAYDTYPTVEARSSVLNAAATRQGDHRDIPVDVDFAVAAISPNGDLIARREGRKVTVWESVTLRRVGEMTTSNELHQEPRIEFTPDGQALVMNELNGGITVRRLTDGHVIRRLKLGYGQGSGFVQSKDGRLIAGGMGSPGIELWDTESDRRIGLLDPGGGPYPAAALSDDNRTLALAGGHGTVDLWDVPTRARTMRLPLDSGLAVTHLAFAPGGAQLVVADHRGEVAVWDIATRSVVAVAARHPGGVYGVAVSPDGRLLASTGVDRRVALWDMRRRVPRTDLPVHRVPRSTGVDLGNLWMPKFAENGTLIASHDGGTLVWNAEQLPDAASTVVDLTFEGPVLHGVDGNGTLITWTTQPQLRRTEARKLVDGHVDGLFSPDGTIVVLYALGRPVTVHKTRDGTSVELRTPGGQTPEIGATLAGFADDERTIVTVTGGQPAVVWDTARPTIADVVDTADRGDSTTAIGFLPGRPLRLVTANYIETEVKITGPDRAVTRLRGHQRPVFAIAATPDGSVLAAAGTDPTVILWNTTTGDELGRLSGHRAAVWQAEVSPDGRLLATGSADGTIILWDLATRTRWATLTGQAGPITALAWSPDSATLAAAGADGTITLWPTDIGTAIRKLCEAIGSTGDLPPTKCPR
ncbi:MAG: transcriptional regulator [Saccharothrix sp.]|nr:transcriptional regulator [Saccharothrix sp.]